MSNCNPAEGDLGVHDSGAGAVGVPGNKVIVVHANELKALLGTRGLARGLLGQVRAVRGIVGGILSACDGEAGEMLVALVSWRPGGGRAGGWGEAAEEVDLAAAVEVATVVKVETELALLSLGGGGIGEGQEGRDVVSLVGVKLGDDAPGSRGDFARADIVCPGRRGGKVRLVLGRVALLEGDCESGDGRDNRGEESLEQHLE